jgi:hypothetical protein
MGEDDEVELEVSGGHAAAPAPAPSPRARAPLAAGTPAPIPSEMPRPQTAPAKRPVVRRSSTPPEPVESGEIVERRSYIIRSSDSQPAIPKVEIREDPTEVVPHRYTEPEVPLVPAGVQRRGPRLVWLLAAIGPAIAAVALSMVETTTRTKPSTLGIQGAAEMIATTLDGAATAVKARAEAIATSSMLRNAIETDAQTLADMARDQDVTFPVAKTETLEIIQVRDATRATLLRLPATAPERKPPPVGQVVLETSGDQLVVVANALIAQRPSGTSGEVVLAVPVDLEMVKKQVGGTTTNASLAGLGAPIVLVSGAAGDPVTLPVQTKILPAGLSLAASTPPATVSKNQALVTGRYACMGLASFLFLIFLGSLVIRRR